MKFWMPACDSFNVVLNNRLFNKLNINRLNGDDASSIFRYWILGVKLKGQIAYSLYSQNLLKILVFRSNLGLGFGSPVWLYRLVEPVSYNQCCNEIGILFEDKKKCIQIDQDKKVVTMRINKKASSS
ncbi:hypothetical protein BpHYR1_021917 [Brachionus plicatilis]|uniref:Uncharacterized protein n=1 Tax=Brachionus plicatilis TaxID=10195 RepID=A0A3M7PMN9_BRAPC|nr:hypothetical protein BpHYR1_021917 [Brachionus plicatilis]